MTKARQEIVKILTSIKDSKLMDDFLQDILTPQEYQDIAMRLQLVKLLDQGKSQREISKKLGAGIATITRGSRVLKYGTGAIKKVLKY